MKTATATSERFIVRADRAGVFYGEIADRRGDEVDMVNARRIHRWEGAASLSQVAMCGVGPKSLLTMPVPRITILGVIEVIPCSPEAIQNLDAHPVWKV